MDAPLHVCRMQTLFASYLYFLGGENHLMIKQICPDNYSLELLRQAGKIKSVEMRIFKKKKVLPLWMYVTAISIPHLHKNTLEGF